MEIIGIAIWVGDQSTMRSGTSAKGAWYTNSFVLDYSEGNYNKSACFDVFSNEARNNWKNWNVQVGKKYKVSFDINSREYNGKWFTGLSAYKCEEIVEQQPVADPLVTSSMTQQQFMAAQQQAQQQMYKQAQQQQGNNNNQGTLPF